MNNTNIEEIKKRMLEIINLLNEWNKFYYKIGNEPKVEDFVYDEKIRELYKLEEENNFFFDFSPTRNVGFKDNNNSLNNINREKKMLSLESINYDFFLLEKFNEKTIKKLEIKEDEIEYICEWKIDGLSISLIYENNILKQVSTRGDGENGEDVTVNKWMIADLPFFLSNIKNCEVRGEVYMKKSNFKELNEQLKKEGKKYMSNPRNAASGSLRNSLYSNKRVLNFFAYQIFLENKDNEINSQFESLKLLEKNNFKISPNYKKISKINEIWEYLEENKKKRDVIDFEADGIVIKVNKHVYQNKLGENNKFPKWALAIKFPSPISKSIIESIEINLSRTGRINYIAKISPIEIQGSIIKKVTLHNWKWISEKKIFPGAEIFIKKAGDVIPQIIEVIKKNDNQIWNPPEYCPYCFGKLIWDENFTYQLCNNYECEERDIRNITYFSSKEGLNIKWISESTIKELFNKKIIKKPIDLFFLKEKKKEIMELKNFREKKFDKIIKSVEDVRKKPFYNFISALGIPKFGIIKAKEMMEIIKIEDFIEMLENNNWKRLKNLFGEKIEKSFENYFLIEINKKNLKEIINLIK